MKQVKLKGSLVIYPGLEGVLQLNVLDDTFVIDVDCPTGKKIIKLLGLEEGKVEITIKRVKKYGKTSI